MQEPGLDRHEWETEWQALEPQVEDSPAEALPELDKLIERMLVEQGHVIEGGVDAELDAEAERDLVAEFLGARQVTRLVEQGETVEEHGSRFWTVVGAVENVDVRVDHHAVRLGRSALRGVLLASGQVRATPPSRRGGVVGS